MGDMLQKMMSNPRAMALMQKAQQNPKIMTALQDVQANGPSAMQKYASDPEIAAVIKEVCACPNDSTHSLPRGHAAALTSCCGSPLTRVACVSLVPSSFKRSWAEAPSKRSAPR